MTWFKSDDGFWRHRKVRKLGRRRTSAQTRVAAAGLWILAGSWSSDQISDGFVPWEQVEEWDPQRSLAAALIAVELWESAEAGGEVGVRFRNWAGYNPLAAEIELEREAARVRMRNSRARRRGAAAPAEQRRSDSVRANTDGTSVEVPDLFEGSSDTPTRPDPTRSSPDGELHAPPDGGATRATREGPDAIRAGRARGRRRNGTVTELAKTARSADAHGLVEAYAADCKLRPGPRLLTSLGVEVDALLARGWPTDVLAAAIAAWSSKGLGPSAFQSVANEVANRAAPAPSARPSTTDQRVASAQALKDVFNSPDGPMAGLRAISGGGGS